MPSSILRTKMGLRIIQINAQHKKNSCHLLINELTHYDIAIIQEPYLSNYSKNIPSIPPDWIVASSGSGNEKALILGNLKTTNLFPLQHFSSDECAVAIATVYHEKLSYKVAIVSIYGIHADKTKALNFLDNHFTAIKNHRGVHYVPGRSRSRRRRSQSKSA